jgi:hypothetical protein
MYDVRPNFIIGFHGCDRAVRDKLVNNPEQLKYSTEPFDWLGHGMYFWENNYTRARIWAEEKKSRGSTSVKNPSVLGAIIHLGFCCDFMDSKYIQLLKSYYFSLEAEYKASEKSIPKNRNIKSDRAKDMLLRELDCTVIEYMHQSILEKWQLETKESGTSEMKNFDTTRGVFTEGGPAFEGAGIFEKSHIQVCVRNPNCIKGFFIPREEVVFPQAKSIS